MKAINVEKKVNNLNEKIANLKKCFAFDDTLVNYIMPTNEFDGTIELGHFVFYSKNDPMKTWADKVKASLPENAKMIKVVKNYTDHMDGRRFTFKATIQFDDDK